MTRKKFDINKKPLSKPEKIQSYKLSLKQKRVSGTATLADSSFDDTTSITSSSFDTGNTTRISMEEKNTRDIWLFLKKNATIIVLMITIGGVVWGLAYKYSFYETSFEYIKKEIIDIKNKMVKIEEDHKKDYQHLDDKINNQIIKNKK